VVGTEINIVLARELVARVLRVGEGEVEPIVRGDRGDHEFALGMDDERLLEGDDDDGIRMGAKQRARQS
jgi:hypothetical protein